MSKRIMLGGLSLGESPAYNTWKNFLDFHVVPRWEESDSGRTYQSHSDSGRWSPEWISHLNQTALNDYGMTVLYARRGGVVGMEFVDETSLVRFIMEFG